MKAMIIEEYGGPQNLKLDEVPRPVPGDDQVLIEIVCAGVNPVDWKFREGLLAEFYPFEFPIILGSDAAGTISALGRNVTGFAVGEKVFVASWKEEDSFGSYAESIAADAVSVAPMPENLTFAEAAGVPLAALTAWQALFDFAGLTAGDVVLVHAAAGGVGSFAVQFAKHAGATVLGTASRANHGYVTGLGADAVIDYRSDDVVAAIMAAHPDGIDVVLDAVGGAAQSEAFEVLKPGGVLVSVVGPPDPALAEEHKVRADDIMFSADGRQLREIAALIEAGAVKPTAVKEIPFEEAARAQVESRAGHVRGKLVLRVREG